MSSPMTMFKLETMIYASEDGTSSVFTLNPALQKQLNDKLFGFFKKYQQLQSQQRELVHKHEIGRASCRERV